MSGGEGRGEGGLTASTAPCSTGILKNKWDDRSGEGLGQRASVKVRNELLVNAWARRDGMVKVWCIGGKCVKR